MKKTLLFLFALLMSGSFSVVFAADANPSNPDFLAQGLNANWGGATYDDATKTITFTSGWNGMGWSFWNSDGDLSAYQTFTIEFEPCDFQVKLYVEYKSGEKVDGNIVAGDAGKVSIAIKPSPVAQIIIQNGDVGDLTLTAAYLEKAEQATPVYTFNFDSDEVGAEYPTIAWSATDINATVEKNPDGEGNALHITSTNWNAYPEFSVTLPKGKTVADVEKITLDVYFLDNGSDQNTYKNIDYFIGEKGTSFSPNTITGNMKNIIGANEDFDTWLPKEITLGQKDGAAIDIDPDLLALNQFDFGIGILCNNGDYYIDNLTFVMKENGGGGEKPNSDAVFDFESDNINKTYPMMHAWGWPEAKSSATVVADPLGISENSLKVDAGNYDGVVYFPVTLPEGYTVADISEIQFDSYFGDIVAQSAAIELFMAVSNAAVGNGVSFTSYPVYLKTSDGTGDKPATLQVSTPDDWYNISITRKQLMDDNFNFSGAVADFSTIDDLSSFLFGIGISVPGDTEYYMDNIKLVLSNNTGIKTVVPLLSKVYGVEGGIITTANGNISVYGIDGRLVKATVANTNAFIALPQGIYIVKMGAANAVKVLVK